MRHYAVVVLEFDHYWTFTYDGRKPFITTYPHIAELHLQCCQENWPNEKYQIVEFDVKELS